MTRFYYLDDSVIDCQLAEAVKPSTNDIAYLADVFTLMNEVNKNFRVK